MLYNRIEYWLREKKNSYLAFSSPSAFTINTYKNMKSWDGTLEYSTDANSWAIWDGTTTLSSIEKDNKHSLYFRGIGNTKISTGTNNRWVISGENVECIGNIENLLDYTIVESGEHPTMADRCYRNLFQNCASLTQAPALPATTLSVGCYQSMFENCTALIQAPALPATTLKSYCYDYMFSGCASLAIAPVLPATTLSGYCYRCMFKNCSNLKKAPDLPALNMNQYGYSGMFQGCTSLTQAPPLPATNTNYAHCYSYMFDGCTNLTQAPELPATTLANNCYQSMFSNCTSLTQAPALPATTVKSFCYASMFQGCTCLTQVPTLPAIELANYCYQQMFQGCSSIKISSAKTGEYTIAYRIPKSRTGTTATGALSNMFYNTGGTFTGTPEINTTYYLSNTNTI